MKCKVFFSVYCESQDDAQKVKDVLGLLQQGLLRTNSKEHISAIDLDWDVDNEETED